VNRVCNRCGLAFADDQPICPRCRAPADSPAAPMKFPRPDPRQAISPLTPAGVRAAGTAPISTPLKWAMTSLKLIVALLGLSAIVAIMAIGSCAYFDYRTPKRASDLLQRNKQPVTQGITSSGQVVRSRDACSLVSNLEVGGALATVVSSAGNGSSTCQYTSYEGKSIALEVTWRGGEMALKFAAMALQGRSRLFGRVAGIGDEAYFGGAKVSATLLFRKADVMVSLEVRNAANAAAAAKLVGQKIAGRL